MDIQSIIFSGLQDIVTILVGALVAYLVAYIKQHFSAKQISTASVIASAAVNFVAQKLDTSENTAKFEAALASAKELAAKAGLKFTDSQWETLIEDAYKAAKDRAKPIETITSTVAPYTEKEITNIIKTEVQKQLPKLSVDMIANIVQPLVQKEISNLSVSVNVSPVITSAQT